MNGRFRKGKKAYKLGRHNKVANRYGSFLQRISRGRYHALKLAQGALIAGMSAMRLVTIQSQIGIDKLAKASAMAHENINCIMAIQKVMTS